MEKWARVMYQPNLPLGEGGVKLTGSKAHIELSKNAAKEGMVLLKNEDGRGRKRRRYGGLCPQSV